jgi:hypothetical protein
MLHIFVQVKKKRVGDIQNVLENFIVEILNNIKLCEEYT